MNLIILYGPPGVGKLTVAKKLSALTGYKLFHNHLAFELVKSLFEVGTDDFLTHTRQIQKYCLKSACSAGVPGMVFTFVYRFGGSRTVRDHAFLKSVVRIVERDGGAIYFVKLWCDDWTLRKRIKQPDRRLFSKVHKLRTLRVMQGKYDLTRDIPHAESLIIDNTELSPRKAAEKIRRHYKLP